MSANERNVGIVFLDIDGVLCIPRDFNRGFKVLNEDCVRVLDNFMARHREARIVISSSWRVLDSLRSIRGAMQRYGFRFGDRIIDTTTTKVEFNGVLYVSRPRLLEIYDWLATHPIPRWSIVIDDEDVSGFGPGYVRTMFEEGLQQRHGEELDEQVRRQTNPVFTYPVRAQL